MKNKKNMFIFISMIAFSAIAGIFARTYFQTNVIAEKYKLRVEYKYFTQESVADEHEAHGKLLAEKSVDIVPERDGQISEVLVKSGQKVKKGDLLYKLKSEQLQAKAAGLDAERKQALWHFNTQKKLINSGSTQKSKHEEAKNRYHKALADHNASKAELEQTQITAPFDGVLNNFNFHVGQYISVHNSKTNNKMTLVSDTVDRVEFAVLNEHANALKEGDELVLKVNNIEDNIIAKIINVETFIGSTLDVKILAEIDPDDRKDIIHGGSAKVLYRTSDIKNVYVIPHKSIFKQKDDQLLILIKKDDNQIGFLPVEIILNDVRNIQGMVGIAILGPDQPSEIDLIINSQDALNNEEFNRRISNTLDGKQSNDSEYEFVEVS